MKVNQLLEASDSKKAGVDEFNKIIEPILGSKIKAGGETLVSLDVAKKLNKAIRLAGYEVETHGATRAGKKVGTVSSVVAKSSPRDSHEYVTFSVRTYKDQSHIFIIHSSIR